MTFCILVGLVLGTKLEQAMRSRMENSLFQKIPGYEVVCRMTRQLAGQGQGGEWQPALVEIEDALVPALIVETASLAIVASVCAKSLLGALVAGGVNGAGDARGDGAETPPRRFTSGASIASVMLMSSASRDR